MSVRILGVVIDGSGTEWCRIDESAPAGISVSAGIIYGAKVADIVGLVPDPEEDPVLIAWWGKTSSRLTHHFTLWAAETKGVHVVSYFGTQVGDALRATDNADGQLALAMRELGLFEVGAPARRAAAMAWREAQIEGLGVT